MNIQVKQILKFRGSLPDKIISFLVYYVSISISLLLIVNIAGINHRFDNDLFKEIFVTMVVSAALYIGFTEWLKAKRWNYIDNNFDYIKNCLENANDRTLLGNTYCRAIDKITTTDELITLLKEIKQAIEDDTSKNNIRMREVLWINYDYIRGLKLGYL